MDVSFVDRRLQKKVMPERESKRNYGSAMSKMIQRRLNELQAAPSLETMRGIGDCHELTGQKEKVLALDLKGSYRMVFRPRETNKPIIDNNILIWENVLAVEILDILDYH